MPYYTYSYYVRDRGRNDKMNRAIFLDRDGTINAEKHYLHRIDDFEFLPGAVESLKLLKDTGYRLIIITNQSGIGRGYYSEDDFKKLNSWMLNELRARKVIIDAVYYCPHLPDAKIAVYRKICDCRKPRLGLYEKAIEDFNIDVAHSWAIGDKIRDCSICEKTDCHGILIGNNEENEIIKSVKNGERSNIQYAENLLSAARIILEEERCI